MKNKHIFFKWLPVKRSERCQVYHHASCLPSSLLFQSSSHEGHKTSWVDFDPLISVGGGTKNQGIKDGCCLRHTLTDESRHKKHKKDRINQKAAQGVKIKWWLKYWYSNTVAKWQSSTSMIYIHYFFWSYSEVLLVIINLLSWRTGCKTTLTVWYDTLKHTPPPCDL